MLGFLDDVFDIRWRHKVPIPIIACIPLLIVYYSERGATDVVVPIPLRWLLGTLINLGALRYMICGGDGTHAAFRSAVLCVHVSPLHVLHQQHQYPRGYQRLGGLASSGYRSLRHSE